MEGEPRYPFVCTGFAYDVAKEVASGRVYEGESAVRAASACSLGIVLYSPLNKVAPGRDGPPGGPVPVDGRETTGNGGCCDGRGWRPGVRLEGCECLYAPRISVILLAAPRRRLGAVGD